MKIKLKRLKEPFILEAENETGNKIILDASPEIGGENTGPRPMELLIMGLAGCSSIDVLMILEKQKIKVLDYSVEIDADREKVEQASLFINIHLHFRIQGEVLKEQVERAISLSLEKYCSVAKTLEKTASITFDFEVIS